MSFIIPSQETRQHLQTNKNKVSGTLQVTKNITLDDESSIRLSHPVVSVMTQDDDADFNNADAMFIGDGKLFVNGAEVFSGDIDYQVLSSHALDTGAPSPNTEDDVMYFNGKQVVSDGTAVKYLTGTTWTAITLTGMDGTVPTVLALFDGQNNLLVGNGSKVRMVDTTWTESATILQLPSQYQVSSMVSNGSVAYIGTRHNASGESRMFIWDGTGASAAESYGTDAFEIASLKSYQSSVVALLSDGRLSLFTGGGFSELGVLPVYDSSYDWSNDNNDYSTVANRGMIVDGDRIYITLSSEVTSDRTHHLHNFHGGVWCYDPKVGLYHRYAPSFTKIQTETIATASVNTTTDVITVVSAPVSGTPVIYNPSGGTFLAPLKQNRAYYVIKVTATTIKLADTYTDAIAGTAIDLTGTGNSSQKLHFYNTNDYGFTLTSNRSAIAVLSDTMRNDIFAGRLAFTSDLQAKQATTNVHSLCTPSPLLPNRGYFITPRLYSALKHDMYNYVFIKYEPLKTDDEIVVKYRTTTREGLPVTVDKSTSNSASDLKGTWSDTDTFTTTHDLSDVVAGDEVEIVKGVGAGFTAHVSSISEAGGTYTVNLDEEFIFASASDIFSFVVDNWTKIGTITSTNEIDTFPIGDAGQFLELKIELRGIETTVTEVQVSSKPYEGV